MKVLQLSKFYPPDHGGIETVAHDLSTGLRRAGVDVEVVCAAKRWAASDGPDADGVRVTRAASLGLWLSTSMAPGVAWHAWRRRQEPDVVHVHMPDPLAALAVWVARPRSKVVLHWHSDVVRQRIARHVYGPLERWLLQRADAVIATSPPYLESSPQLRSVRDKVAVIPLGVRPPDPVDPQVLARLRREHGDRRIVFALGRMTYYKGWDVLVDATRHLPEDVLVVVAGGGPELPQYRALADAPGVRDRVRFVGAISRRRVEAYFALAQVFCMASTLRAEAFGVAVLEAMARGVPVVATDIPGSGLGWLHRDGETGLQVPPNNPRRLAAALERMLADAPMRRRCGAAGRARWAAHFTAETMALQTLDLYRRLLA